jgi:hypothetical protein
MLKIKKSYKKKETLQKPQPGSPTHANLKPFGGTSDDENHQYLSTSIYHEGGKSQEEKSRNNSIIPANPQKEQPNIAAIDRASFVE